MSSFVPIFALLWLVICALVLVLLRAGAVTDDESHWAFRSLTLRERARRRGDRRRSDRRSRTPPIARERREADPRRFVRRRDPIVADGPRRDSRPVLGLLIGEGEEPIDRTGVGGGAPPPSQRGFGPEDPADAPGSG